VFPRFPLRARAFIIRRMTIKRFIARWPWVGAVGAVCLGLLVRVGGAANVEPTIIPSVHATLVPTSAIQVPLRLTADQTSVWRNDLEQRMLLSGRVSVLVGYRQLQADHAAVWLTPSRESGESTLDVAIYLAGNVQVREGNSANSTLTVGKELLVTTRVSQGAQLAGNPVSKSEEDSPIVKRGNEIRTELLARRLAPLHVPQIVFTPAEEALQAGWIARGPDNRIIPGPGDIQVVRDAQGNITSVAAAAPPGAAKPTRPRPNIFATGDDTRTLQVGNELVTILPGAYLLMDRQDGRPPLEFRAQRLVAFSPVPEEKPAATAPSTAKSSSHDPAPTKRTTTPTSNRKMAPKFAS